MKPTKPEANAKRHAFLKGFASAFDITGQTLLERPNLQAGFQRDAEALRGDWIMVGNDLRKAMDTVKSG